MNLLKDEQIKEIKEIFKNLSGPVEVLFFGKNINCTYCEDTENLLRQITNLDDRIKFQSYNFLTDSNIAKKFLIFEVPATVIKSDKKDYGIVYYGIPSGYEFSTILNAMVMVSQQEDQLSARSMEALKHVVTPVIIKVFVTPNCPYCPNAALMAFKFAMANDYIGAYVYEASEFPHLVQRYQVMGVPKMIFNEELNAEGAIPESSFLSNVLKAAAQSGSRIPEKKPECRDDIACNINDQNFDKEVLEPNVPVLVDFYADWCKPCKLLASTIDKLKQHYKGKAKVLKLNTDENPKSSSKYGIRSIPCVMVFYKGEIQQELLGLRPITDYKKAIDELLNKP